MKREVIVRRSSIIEPILGGAVIVLLLGVVTERGRDHGAHSAYYAVHDLARSECTHRRWIDPWGMPYAVYCGRTDNIAQSFGPDRIPNTTDDIWSNR